MSSGRARTAGPWVAALLASAAVAAHIHFQLESVREEQADRVRFLEREIAKLELDTEEVRNLPAHIADYLGRMNVLEALQKDRLQPVWLMDELPRLRPQGLYYTSVRFNQSRVEVEGFASSRVAVEKFIDNVSGSARLGLPKETSAGTGTAPLAAFPVGFSVTAQMRARTGEPAR